MLHLVWYGLLAIVLAGGLFALAARFLPAGEQIAPPLRDEPPWELPPDRSLNAEEIDSVRLPVALRGYRFAETDLLLDRLAAELRVRDDEIARLRGGAPALLEPAPAELEPLAREVSVESTPGYEPLPFDAPYGPAPVLPLPVDGAPAAVEDEPLAADTEPVAAAMPPVEPDPLLHLPDRDTAESPAPDTFHFADGGLAGLFASDDVSADAEAAPVDDVTTEPAEPEPEHHEPLLHLPDDGAPTTPAPDTFSFSSEAGEPNAGPGDDLTEELAVAEQMTDELAVLDPAEADIDQPSAAEHQPDAEPPVDEHAEEQPRAEEQSPAEEQPSVEQLGAAQETAQLPVAAPGPVDEAPAGSPPFNPPVYAPPVPAAHLPFAPPHRIDPRQYVPPSIEHAVYTPPSPDEGHAAPAQRPVFSPPSWSVTAPPWAVAAMPALPVQQLPSGSSQQPAAEPYAPPAAAPPTPAPAAEADADDPAAERPTRSARHRKRHRRNGKP